MKPQIIKDTLRSLKHPEFLKDLVINCYLIAQHIEDLEAEDIEKVIIDGLPLNSLPATARHLFEELDRLRKMKADNPEIPPLDNRFAGIKRILKRVSRRLVQEDVHGAQGFLEKLYLSQVLSFEELPSDVQYLINTDKMADDTKRHIRSYVKRCLHQSPINKSPSALCEDGLCSVCFVSVTRYYAGPSLRDSHHQFRLLILRVFIRPSISAASGEVNRKLSTK